MATSPFRDVVERTLISVMVLTGQIYGRTSALVQQRRMQFGEHAGELGGRVLGGGARAHSPVLDGQVDDIGLSLGRGPHRPEVAQRDAETVSAQRERHRAQGARVETAMGVGRHDADGDQLLELSHGGAGVMGQRSRVQAGAYHRMAVRRHHTRDRSGLGGPGRGVQLGEPLSDD